MIPQFPEFAGLTLAHRPAIDAFVRGFPPYSDFNALSLIAWDTKDTTAVSFIHGNLAVRMHDYVTGERFYTFIGSEQLLTTATLLIELSASSGGRSTLRLVPETVASALDSAPRSPVKVHLDRGGFDYILSVDNMCNLSGSALKKKRRNVETCRKRHPSLRIDQIDVATPDIAEGMRTLFKTWQTLKNRSESASASEFSAIERCIRLASHFDLVCVGAFLRGTLVGWTINERVHDSYCMAHFGKSDPRYTGLTDLLEHETAKVIASAGCSVLNLQQDLGLPGLRASKNSWSPLAFLRKFTVELQA